MRAFFPVFFSIVAIGILSLVEIFLLKKLHKDWWRHRWVRVLSYGLPLSGLVSLAVWSLGIYSGEQLLVAAGAYTTSVLFLIGIALMLSLPFSAILHGVDWLLQRFRTRKTNSESESPVSEDRRRLLRTAAAGFPLIAVTAGGTGFSQSFQDPLTPEIPLSYKDLPANLEGLRVLHISDVHLGFFITMQNLERMIELSIGTNPDLVLITGDFCDDVLIYEAGLKLVNQIHAKHGIFASIGNHEYFRGFTRIRSIFDKGPIPLLLDSGAALRIGEADLYIAGADDPRRMSATDTRFFPTSIDRAMQDSPAGAFTILMSHRPEGFDFASDTGIQLTLAGHTHGGQIGFNGKSIQETMFGRKYTWGKYTRGSSILYTSAGAGHWFPYRIGCPAEMPLYILRRDGSG